MPFAKIEVRCKRPPEPVRSLRARRQLHVGIVRRFGALGIAPADALIVLQGPPLDNWCIRRGVPASEAALGLELNV